MRKIGVLSNFLFLSIVLAGGYGILHDQITATLSPEYFTRFKFPQFGVAPAFPFRQGVAIVGFFATWWMGLFIGLILGLTGLLFPDHKLMRRYTFQALIPVFLVTVTIGILGYLYGRFYRIYHLPAWYFPEGLSNKNSFIIAGSIHNAGYIGGIIGLLFALIYLLYHLRHQKRQQ